jgi:hypothetical protein
MGRKTNYCYLLYILKSNIEREMQLGACIVNIKQVIDVKNRIAKSKLVKVKK